jgi:MFS family permease
MAEPDERADRAEPAEGRLETAGRLGAAFWRLWLAAVGSRFGDSIRIAALALLTAETTHSSIALSLVVACNYLPWLAFGLLAGALVDRVQYKNRAFLIGDLSRAVLLVLLAVLVAAHLVSVPLLIVFALLLSTCQTISDSSFNSILPRIVDTSLLAKAHARLSAGQGFMGQLSGAPVGAALFAAFRALPFAADSLSFFAAALLIGSIAVRRPGEPAAGRFSFADLIGDVRFAIGFIVRNPSCSGYAYIVGIMNLAGAGVQGTLILYVLHILHSGPYIFGLLTAAWGGGSITGNLLAEFLAGRIGNIPTAALAILLQLPGYLVLFVAPDRAMAFVGMALYGLSCGLWNVASNAELMTLIPADLLGRVSGALRLISLSAAPVGALLAGVLIALSTARAPSAVGVAMDLCAFGLFWRLILRSYLAARPVSGRPAAARLVAERELR